MNIWDFLIASKWRTEGRRELRKFLKILLQKRHFKPWDWAISIWHAEIVRKFGQFILFIYFFVSFCCMFVAVYCFSMHAWRKREKGKIDACNVWESPPASRSTTAAAGCAECCRSAGRCRYKSNGRGFAPDIIPLVEQIGIVRIWAWIRVSVIGFLQGDRGHPEVSGTVCSRRFAVFCADRNCNFCD